MNIIIIGARKDGHAAVVLDAIRLEGKHTVVGFVDDDTSLKGVSVHNIPVLGVVGDIPSFRKRFEVAIIAIGDNIARCAVGKKLEQMGIPQVSVFHPTAIIAPDVVPGNGTFVAAGAIINTGTRIGKCVIINTGTTIDHDNIIGDYVHVGPGSHTAGRVTINESSFLGIGSKVIPNVLIGARATIGAGSVVLHDVPDDATCVGVPARVIKIKGVAVHE